MSLLILPKSSSMIKAFRKGDPVAFGKWDRFYNHPLLVAEVRGCLLP